MEDVASWEFECNSVLELPGYDVTCEMKHGKQDLKSAFCNSCNCAFAALAQEIGSETFAEYVDKFGVADSVTFDGITTAKGNYEMADNASDLAWSAVGQHTNQIVAATFMNFVGAIANGGQGVTPYIVEDVSVRDNSIYSSKTAVQERILSENTASVLRDYMRNNVATKYGDSNFPGLTVCAKTGTAEVDPNGEIAPNAMLTGFVMDEAYPLAFIVCAEDAGYGRSVCVPIMSKVLTACKNVIDNQ
jgi:peptidoglycan glycosyltransferase